MNIHELNAYEVIEERKISDVSSMGYILRHKKSGARVCILSNDDDNKVFYVGFRTPPEDETGVPHIIEHTVLCGSEKFPLKDPFVELVKGSLNTFLNAMTYPDKTVYPIASYNDKDFKNLMDVYMDAVFHPNIVHYEEIFKQEGWHYELEDKAAPLTINGVVYNEMKGAYSSPDEVLQTEIFRSLFPDNTYSKNSGGNPKCIPQLTYEDYLAFYKKYYHPSNSYIYLYGDMDVVERLTWMDEEYLSKYDAMQVDSEIQMQSGFSKVQKVTQEYSIASDDSMENQTYLSYNKVIASVLDKELYQAFDILDYALVSAPGAPIKKALIDAGIGQDVYGSFESGVLQPVFSIVAKNANPEDEERFVSIIEETLQNIVAEGLNKKALLAGINSSEFRFREADFGHYPKGLLYGLQCLESWLSDDNQPFLHLECLDTFAFLKESVETGYFEKLIQTYLLDNKHGSIVKVVPKQGLNVCGEEALAKELEAYKASLSDAEIEKLIADTIHLKEYQDEPSLEEDLKKLPMLTREDMKKEAMPFSNEEELLDGMKVVRHDIFTNGIDYISLFFDAEDVAIEDIGYLGSLCGILGYVDTASYGYADFSNAIHIYSGGVHCNVSLFPNVKESGKNAVKFEIRIKVLEDQLEEVMKLIDEMIQTSKLSDTKRLLEIVTQTKSRLQIALSSSGHTVSAMRAMSYFSQYGYYQDALHGVEYYRFICNLEELLRQDASKVTENLERICKQLFNTNRLTIGFTGNNTAYQKAKPVLAEFLNRLPDYGERKAIPSIVFSQKNEGLTDASQIQYVARTGNFISQGFSYTGALRILKMILSYDFLWMNIRVKGGAYGCMSAFLRTGESYFVSYRDPNLAKTNAVFEGIPEYLKNFNPDERDMTKYIIGTFGNLDTPLYPEGKGSRSMAAYFSNLSYEDVQKERDEILNATTEDIRALADLVQSILDGRNLCVIGNENAIKSEAEMFQTIGKLY